MSNTVTLDVAPLTTGVEPSAATTHRAGSTSRRRLLAGVATAAVAGVALQAVRPTQASAAEDDQVMHLLRRTTFGPTPALVAEVRRVGASAWLAQQLDPASVSDPDMDQLAARWPRLGLKAWEVREQIQLGQFAKWDLMYDVVEHHMARAIWSKRQVFEVVVDFWTNHLVIPTPIGEVYDCSHLFSRDVIRKHALGTYAEMLVASAKHPAMLSVLDNSMSSKRAPNENYGRELLELHTVGIGNYTETDVKNSALALTGLSVDGEGGMYEFKPWRRYVGPVKVMDWSNANGNPEEGEKVALDYLNALARHPKTAERLARKLCVRFVSDTPPSSLVDKLAQVYLANDTAILPVLKALFASDEFAASVGQKVKTPYEDVIATLRIVGLAPQPTGTSELRSLYWNLRELGQAPMGWTAPNGYPDVAAAWTGTASTIGRWNFHVGVVADYKFKLMPKPGVEGYVTSVPSTHGALIDALADRLLLRPLTDAQRTAACTFLTKKPGDPLKAGDAAVGWRFKYLLGLLLDSHNFTVR